MSYSELALAIRPSVTFSLDSAFIGSTLGLATAVITRAVPTLRQLFIDAVLFVLSLTVAWCFLAITNNGLILGSIIAASVSYGGVLARTDHTEHTNDASSSNQSKPPIYNESNITDSSTNEPTETDHATDNVSSSEQPQSPTGTVSNTTDSSTDDSSGIDRSTDDPTVGPTNPSLEASSEHTFDDVGGMDDLIETLTERIVDPLDEPERYAEYGLGTVGGVLLYGPPGCGKTYLAEALAGETEYRFIEITPTEVTSKWVGEAADNVADVFDTARNNQPCLLFIDEIDAIASDRSGRMTTSEQQLVNQLLIELDAIGTTDVIVVAATNHVSDIDDAILRSGRFDERIEVPPPDAAARREILTLHLADRPTDPNLEVTDAVAMTAGYAASDLELVAELAARHALDEEQPVGTAHLERAIEETTTSLHDWIDRYDWLAVEDDGIVDRTLETDTATHGVTTSHGDEADGSGQDIYESFDSIAGRKSVKDELWTRVIDPIRNGDAYAAQGIEPPSGALLLGPPGCDRTALAHGVAAELEASLFELTPALLYDKQREASIDAFESTVTAARAADNAVLCLDRLENITPTGDDQPWLIEQFSEVVSTELDSLRTDGVVVIATATSAEAIDPTVLAAPCFDERIQVPLPNRRSRRAILETEFPDGLLDPTIDWDRILEATDGFTSDDLRTTAVVSAREAIRANGQIDTERVIETADQKRPSVRQEV